MINQQDNGLSYAYCPCGVCGPLRARRSDARADDRAHRSVCTARKAAA